MPIKYGYPNRVKAGLTEAGSGPDEPDYYLMNELGVRDSREKEERLASSFDRLWEELNPRFMKLAAKFERLIAGEPKPGTNSP